MFIVAGPAQVGGFMWKVDSTRKPNVPTKQIFVKSLLKNIAYILDGILGAVLMRAKLQMIHDQNIKLQNKTINYLLPTPLYRVLKL